ncbi:MFS transporter [Actinosynnema sp. NPDC047251]|uniref:Puromycin resistance protein n=1 Tax=Saccharothrix espanaensis (strain ATCC 51144 / DSM 44229 / JCM 9112 / NBRC 15066 / NRRL 15764) TaxID=1179773 RepID=K0JW38_SACES|nr:MFS transporter [Saccharothrix espanaensis]CCH28413.1 Puromycin resistance protein [Saccharothrix espanaensis DSM 44229]
MGRLQETTATGHRDRWRALAVLATAQLLAAVDVTIMVIALPSAQRDVGLADGDKHWVLVAYSLTLGALLLAGGRVGDRIGQRRALVVGVLGFTAASAVGGVAPDAATLIGSRVGQGVFAAMLVPAALSLVSVTFTDRAERARAFAAFSATLMAGAAVGQVLGGALTTWADWRWCMYVNVPIGVAVVVAALKYVPATRPSREARIDVPGVLLAAGGLGAIVYALGEVDRNGWFSQVTLGLLGAGLVLLAAFLHWQTRARRPLLPLGVPAHRSRAGANLAVVAAQFAMFGMFLFLTYQLQVVSGFSALRTGLAFLPFVAVSVLATRLALRLLAVVRPRLLIPAGLVLIGGGFAFLVALTPTSSYVGLVLPALVLAGVGSGLLMAPSMSAATTVEDVSHAGPASALVRTSQQIGAALGPAVLGGLASAYTDVPAGGAPDAAAIVRGYASAGAWAAAILMGTALVVALLLPRKG